MTPTERHDDVLARFRNGHVGTLSRVVSLVENRRPGFENVLTALYPDVGRAQRIGITGPPGAGKSTLADRLVAEYRARGASVAVVAVDPTSPFTGGALLGDRVRMDSAAGDRGVFVRSMATRGAQGGLATTTVEVCDVLDAFGFDRIIVETVGVGQSELAIAATADTTVVVLVPESGDAVQALKAGILEIGHVVVVNKSDRPQADRIVRDVEEMLSIRNESEPAGWRASVVKTVATEADGVTELVAALDERAAYLAVDDRLHELRRVRLRRHVRDIVDRSVSHAIWASGLGEGVLNQHEDRLLAGTMSAYTVAGRILGLFKGEE